MPSRSAYPKRNSNYAPSESEITALRMCIAGPDGKLHDLEERIAATQAVYQKHVQERNKLRYQIEAHVALLAPMRRVHDDILEEIFYHCLPNDRNPVMSSSEAPILLGRICKRWRYLSLASPRLWAALHIPIHLESHSLPNGRSDHTRIQKIAEWLSRSGDCPLSISLFLHRDVVWEGAYSSFITQPYLDILLPLAKRWKNIHLYIPGITLIDILKHIQESDVPLLECLSIKDKLRGRDHQPSLLTSAIKTSGLLRAPRLRSISLAKLKLPFFELPIQWSRLTELSLLEPTKSLLDIAQVLAICHELRSCSIRLTGYPLHAIDHLDLPSISLPKLLHLTIIDASVPHVSRLLQIIHAPAIRHLSYNRALFAPFSQETVYRTLFQEALTTFIGRAVWPIEELNLTTYCMADSDVIVMLSLLPGLRRLVIRSSGRYPDSPPWEHNFSFDDTTLRRFILGQHPRSRDLDPESPAVLEHDSNGQDQQGVCLCPRLEILHCTGASFSGTTLLKFLKSRSFLSRATAQATPLKEVDVTFSSGWEPADRIKKKIRKLGTKTGITVNLTYPASSPLVLRSPQYPQYSAYIGTSHAHATWLTSPSRQVYFGF